MSSSLFLIVSCNKQVVNLDEYARFQFVINTIHATTFCDQDFLDIKDRVSYALTHKKEVLVNGGVFMQKIIAPIVLIILLICPKSLYHMLS